MPPQMPSELGFILLHTPEKPTDPAFYAANEMQDDACLLSRSEVEYLVSFSIFRLETDGSFYRQSC
jgi:hypothetical protein